VIPLGEDGAYPRGAIPPDPALPYASGMTRRGLALDTGLFALVLGLSLVMLAQGGLGTPSAGTRALDGVGAALVVGTALPLLARQRAPLAAYLVTSVSSLALLALGYPLDVPLGPLVAINALATAPQPRSGEGRRWWAVLPAAGLAPATAAILAVRLDGAFARATPALGIWALAGVTLWLAGDRARLRRERIDELEERARQLEHATERERRLAAAEERTRIARELHDAAGHAINVILVQAGAARLLQERDPCASLQAMATIEEVARDTVAEIDLLVRALRDGDQDDGPDGRVPAGPVAVEELVDRHRAGGLDVSATVGGERRVLPRRVAWASYRIVQEALTNAARHGGGQADVVLRYGPDALELTVTNPFAPAGAPPVAPTGPGGGHGIVGMRERAELTGGSLEAGPRDGAFRLTARLPYGEVAGR
jgi:signal transduction histidine kinase